MDLNHLCNYLDNGWIMADGLIERNIKYSKKLKMFNLSHQWVHQVEDVMKFQEEFKPNSL